MSTLGGADGEGQFRQCWHQPIDIKKVKSIRLCYCGL